MAIYSDLNSFSPTDRELLIDLGAIFQSIFNILNTEPGERFFEPEFGITFEDELFGLIDDISSLEIFSKITESVERFEDRVIVDFGATQVFPDPVNHRFIFDLVFDVQGLENPQQFSFRGEVNPSE